MKKEITKIVFRKWKGTNDIIALFPDIREVDHTILCYQHIGQHGFAEYRHCIKYSTLANPSEYATLKKELKGLGYKNIKVLKRAKVKY